MNHYLVSYKLPGLKWFFKKIKAYSHEEARRKALVMLRKKGWDLEDFEVHVKEEE